MTIIVGLSGGGGEDGKAKVLERAVKGKGMEAAS